MKQKSLKIPAIILVIGFGMAIVASLLTGIVKVPVITEHDFPFTVTYQLDGETNTLEGIYRGRFVYTGKGTAPLNRYYEGEYLSNTEHEHPATYTISEKDGLKLCIIVIFSARDLMGDSDGVSCHYDPYLAVLDSEGVEYSDEETLSQFDAEIIDWVYPKPVGNSFRFAGFSGLHDGSMFAMLAVGILTILACMIFVKRDKTVPYRALDKVSIVMNFVISLAAIPFLTVFAAMVQIIMSGDEFVYQLFLSFPAITAFTVAASVALRRVRFTKTGFFVQFAVPVLFALVMLLGSDSF